FLCPKNPKPDVDLGMEILYLGQRSFHERPARLPGGSIERSRKYDVSHLDWSGAIRNVGRGDAFLFYGQELNCRPSSYRATVGAALSVSSDKGANAQTRHKLSSMSWLFVFIMNQRHQSCQRI